MCSAAVSYQACCAGILPSAPHLNKLLKVSNAFIDLIFFLLVPYAALFLHTIFVIYGTVNTPRFSSAQFRTAELMLRLLLNTDNSPAEPRLRCRVRIESERTSTLPWFFLSIKCSSSPSVRTFIFSLCFFVQLLDRLFLRSYYTDFLCHSIYAQGRRIIPITRRPLAES